MEQQYNSTTVVPQESFGGPLLFNIFLNDLQSRSKYMEQNGVIQ